MENAVAFGDHVYIEIQLIQSKSMQQPKRTLGRSMSVDVKKIAYKKFRK